jgi:hypothetical protein
MADSTDTGSTADFETEEGVIKNKFFNAVIYNLRSNIKNMTIMVQALESAIHEHELSMSESEEETGQEGDIVDQTETEAEQNLQERIHGETAGDQEEAQAQTAVIEPTQGIEPVAKSKAERARWIPCQPPKAPPLTMLLQKHLRRNISKEAKNKTYCPSTTSSPRRLPPRPPSPPWKRARRSL